MHDLAHYKHLSEVMKIHRKQLFIWRHYYGSFVQQLKHTSLNKGWMFCCKLYLCPHIHCTSIISPRCKGIISVYDPQIAAAELKGTTMQFKSLAVKRLNGLFSDWSLQPRKHFSHFPQNSAPASVWSRTHQKRRKWSVAADCGDSDHCSVRVLLMRLTRKKSGGSRVVDTSVPS